MTDNDFITTEKEESLLSLPELWHLLQSNWYWFLISLVISLGAAFIYLLKTPAVYVRQASIVIKDQAQNNRGFSGTDLADFDFFSSNVNIENEILTLKAEATMAEVVNKLKLNTAYYTRKGLKNIDLYRTSPIQVLFSSNDPNLGLSCSVEILPDNQVRLSQFSSSADTGIIETEAITGTMLNPIITPIDTIWIIPTVTFSKEWLHTSINIIKTPVHTTAKNFATALQVELAEKKSTFINLSIQDVSTRRADDVLNTLIQVYNDNWIKDKNLIAISTSAFINERLKVIEHELGDVDDNISDFKSKNLLPDIAKASDLYMQQSTENDKHLLALSGQLAIAGYIRQYMNDPVHNWQLLPSNSGIENLNIEKQISEYNALILQRSKLINNSSERNPLLVNLNESITAMRNAIIHSMDNLIVTLKMQMDNLQHSEKQTTERIASSPDKAKYLLSVERQQKVKEALYLYLLQKREENELSQAFTAYNTRIVNPPYGDPEPASPRNKKVLLIAFAIGLLLPFGILYLLSSLNTTVRGRKDLEKLTLPFAGEIPYAGRKKRYLTFKKQETEPATVVVKEKNRNIINEAFRVVRTNMDFMRVQTGETQVTMFTSFNPGSGKTFISINLAVSMAIKGKKAVVIDLDMRKASLSAYINSPSRGISGYLSGQIQDYNEIIYKGELHPLLDIIPVGTLPPNPAELLLENRLENLLHELRQSYDYIFIDCPPVALVADASIIGKFADLTVFVVRCRLMDRRMLPDIEALYQEHKFKSMALILNGTFYSSARYGYHKYGYSYGYGEGYYGK